MEPYRTEQHLPCTLPQVFSWNRRKPLEGVTHDAMIGLRGNVDVIAMNIGFQVHTIAGIFFSEDDTLLRALATPTPYGEVRQYQEGLEEFNYYGLLETDPAQVGHVSYHDVNEEVKARYSPGTLYSWFCYVPAKLEIDLSTVCNFRCIHCSREAGPVSETGQQELSLQGIRHLITEAATIGVRSVSLMGGEPTIYPHFLELLQFARTLGIRHLGTSTNAWRSTSGLAADLSEYIHEIQVSLHGASADVHDTITRKRGAFEQAKRAIGLLSSNGVKVTVSFTVMHENRQDIPRMPGVVKELGAKALRYLVLSPQGRGAQLRQWTREEVDTIGDEIRGVKDAEPEIHIQAGGFPPLSATSNECIVYGCPAGRELLYISATGRVTCCGVVEEDIGSVGDASILELWHSPKMIALRAEPKCDCEFKPICSGPCRFAAANPYGS